MVNDRPSEKTIVCNHLNDISTVAKEIIREAGDCTIWLFEGAMGAGKTTLIKAICNEFKVVDNVSSPTFSLVNEYQNTAGKIFYHFDFYRITNEIEAMDIGCYEYFDSGNICLIEWPSHIPNLIPDYNVMINIEANLNQSRSISLFKNG